MINCIDNIETALRSRRSYHTNVKFLAKLDLLPEETFSSIPKSNISRWRNTDFSEMIGIKSSDSGIYQKNKRK